VTVTRFYAAANMGPLGWLRQWLEVGWKDFRDDFARRFLHPSCL